MKETSAAIDRTTIELEQEKNRVDAQQNIIPTIQNVIKLYRKTKDPAKKKCTA